MGGTLPSPALPNLSDLIFETGIAARSFADFVTGSGLRLGVTGLSRAGKTVFITALVHQLTRAAKVAADNRIRAQGRLARRPDLAQHRHRRLSRRMAPRPAAARQELCAMVV